MLTFVHLILYWYFILYLFLCFCGALSLIYFSQVLLSGEEIQYIVF